MKDLKSYIESGILESYVLGLLSDSETAEVLELISRHAEVAQEVEKICQTMEQLYFSNAVAPDPTIKPFLLARADFTNRLENGEVPTFPPELHEGSTIADYTEWINRPDMVLKGELEDFYVRIIGYMPGQTTTIIWIKEMTPPEVHHKEYEKFLILEGTCDVRIGEQVHHLKPGDYMSIPLHVDHAVTVTSSIPCKAILQRIAC